MEDHNVHKGTLRHLDFLQCLLLLPLLPALPLHKPEAWALMGIAGLDPLR